MSISTETYTQQIDCISDYTIFQKYMKIDLLVFVNLNSGF